MGHAGRLHYGCLACLGRIWAVEADNQGHKKRADPTAPHSAYPSALELLGLCRLSGDHLGHTYAKSVEKLAM